MHYIIYALTPSNPHDAKKERDVREQKHCDALNRVVIRFLIALCDHEARLIRTDVFGVQS
jgi:hypothetical protein